MGSPSGADQSNAPTRVAMNDASTGSASGTGIPVNADQARLIPSVHARNLVALLCNKGLVNSRTQTLLPFLRLEPEMFFLPNIIGPGAVALDIGANVGIYAGVLSRIVGPNGTVFALEPYPPTYNQLVRNLARMRVRNVRALKLAVANLEGDVSLELPLRGGSAVNDPYVHVTPGSSGRGATRATTVDELSRRSGLSRLDFIKIDVEGFESAVIEGALWALEEFRPKLLVEIFDDWARRYASDFRRVNDTLLGLGYSGFLLERGELVAAPRAARGSRNYFYLPNAR